MDIRHTSKHSGSSEGDRATSGVPSVVSTAQLSRTHYKQSIYICI